MFTDEQRELIRREFGEDIAEWEVDIPAACLPTRLPKRSTAGRRAGSPFLQPAAGDYQGSDRPHV